MKAFDLAELQQYTRPLCNDCKKIILSGYAICYSMTARGRPKIRSPVSYTHLTLPTNREV